jgi:hypothetical protein
MPKSGGMALGSSEMDQQWNAGRAGQGRGSLYLQSSPGLCSARDVVESHTKRDSILSVLHSAAMAAPMITTTLLRKGSGLDPGWYKTIEQCSKEKTHRFTAATGAHCTSAA